VSASCSEWECPLTSAYLQPGGVPPLQQSLDLKGTAGAELEASNDKVGNVGSSRAIGVREGHLRHHHLQREIYTGNEVSASSHYTKTYL
jgi:hypothetical protein